MSEFRGYLERLQAPPAPDDLSGAEQRYVNEHFEAHAAEVYINGAALDWDRVDAVEVVAAARVAGPSGWLLKQLIGTDRYHLGIYAGKQEQILTNIPLTVAQFIVQTIAYHAPNPVRYSGVEGLAPIAFDS